MLKKKKTEEDVKTNLMYRVIDNIKKKMDSSKVTDTVYEKMTEKPNDKKYIYKNKGLKDQTYSISDINIEDDSIKVVLDNPVNLKVDDSSPYGTHYESFILEQRFVKELFAKIMGETNTENLTDDELDEAIDKVLDKVLDKKDIIQTSIDDTLKKDFNFGKEGYKGKQVVSYELSQLKDEKADIPRKSVLLGGAGAVTATIINGIKTYLAQNKATAEEQAKILEFCQQKATELNEKYGTNFTAEGLVNELANEYSSSYKTIYTTIWTGKTSVLVPHKNPIEGKEDFFNDYNNTDGFGVDGGIKDIKFSDFDLGDFAVDCGLGAIAGVTVGTIIACMPYLKQRLVVHQLNKAIEKAEKERNDIVDKIKSTHKLAVKGYGTSIERGISASKHYKEFTYKFELSK